MTRACGARVYAFGFALGTVVSLRHQHPGYVIKGCRAKCGVMQLPEVLQIRDALK